MSQLRERHRKTFSRLYSCLTDSSWIHLILLIKLIQYKIGKRRLVFPPASKQQMSGHRCLFMLFNAIVITQAFYLQQTLNKTFNTTYL